VKIVANDGENLRRSRQSGSRPTNRPLLSESAHRTGFRQIMAITE